MLTTRKIIGLALLAFLFPSCKASMPTGPSSGTTPSLLEVQNVLDTTGTMFIQFANETNGDAYKAILSTAYWLSRVPNVQSAFSFDSVSIDIVLKSGIKAKFYFDPVNDSGFSVTRGGHGEEPFRSIRNDSGCSVLRDGHEDETSHSTRGMQVDGMRGMQVDGMQSTNTITNDSVLFFAPGYSSFGLSEAHMRSLFAASPLNLNVTVLKNSECTYQRMQQFGNYGLVIIDTHGLDDCLLLGTTISVATKPKDEATFKNLVISQIGQDGYDRLVSGDLIFGSGLKVNNLITLWQQTVIKPNALDILATSQYVRSLPQMPNTVIFGNMCFSGWTLASRSWGSEPFHLIENGVDTIIMTTPGIHYYDGIGTAFIGRNPISYYGYAFLNALLGESAEVSDPFSKAMEDTLVTNFVNNFDSTKIANLQYDRINTFIDPNLNGSHVMLLHFGSDNYSYPGPCIHSFIDDRDGQLYHTVCIGNQIWMSQNLNYNAPGSFVYDSLPSNGAIYGRLYDWNTVMQGKLSSSASPSGVQGVCPKGWHVPSFSELLTMEDFLGGDSIAGGPMKSRSSLWQSPNTGATNKSGFSGLPGGEGILAGSNHYFDGIGILAKFWTTYDVTTNGTGGLNAWDGSLDNQSPNAWIDQNYKIMDLSCRCVKDP